MKLNQSVTTIDLPRVAESVGWQEFTYITDDLTDALNTASSEPLSDAEILGVEHTLKPETFPLSKAKVGDRVRIVALNCGGSNPRLRGMGLNPNIELDVISCTANGSVIIALNDNRLGLGADMSHCIQVSPITHPSSNKTAIKTNMTPKTSSQTVKLRDAAIGARLRVVGYDPTARAYKRKLLAMGLTPGTELTVTRHAPLGDPTQIEVRGFYLSLRKDEADALQVEAIES